MTWLIRQADVDRPQVFSRLSERAQVLLRFFFALPYSTLFRLRRAYLSACCARADSQTIPLRAPCGSRQVDGAICQIAVFVFQIPVLHDAIRAPARE